LYEEPTTTFVADFLGVSNLMDAQVSRCGDAQRPCRLSLGDFSLDASAGRVDAVGAVKLAIRPERVDLFPHGGSGANRVPGMVERVVFLGATTHVHVRLATGSALQALVRNDGNPLPYSQGTPVSIALPADALRVLPDVGTSASGAGDNRPGDEALGLTSSPPVA
jgi:ABC-type Fe3+/spermidine/putrescine transport system ATPase subunit